VPDGNILARIDAVHAAVMGRNAKQIGNGEVAFTCPNPDRHQRGDMHPSARWNLDKGAWHCDVCGAGGGVKNLAEALGITVKPERTAVREITYDYQDADGKRLFQVVRREFSDGTKTFSQRRTDHSGKWVWDLKGVRRVLYGLPEIISADEDEPVLVNEGEKAVAAARSLGYVATTNPGGAGKWRPTFNEALAGRHVVILPDNDAPGQGHGQLVAAALLPHAASVRVVNLPGLPARGDVHDWVAAGHGRDELAALIAATDTYIVPPITGRGNGSGPVADLFAHHRTELGNSRRFRDQAAGKALWCETFRRWYFWDGRRFAPDDVRGVELLAHTIARRMYEEARDLETGGEWAKFALQSEKRQAITATVEGAKALLPVRPADLDRDGYLLNLPNATFDLRTDKARPHDMADRLTKLAGAAYDPNAKCPAWLRFLDRIGDGEGAWVTFAQRLFGLALCGEILEHILVILWGAGLNGKGTLLQILRALLGDYAAHIPADLLTTKRDDPQGFFTAPLVGARAVTAEEPGRTCDLDEGFVKALTGAAPQNVAHKHGQPFSFTPVFTPLLATNHLPTIRGTDWGIWRRVKLWPFTVTIPEAERRPDAELRAELEAELPGILNWAFEGWAAYREKGLDEPELVKLATREYRSQSDLLGDWIEERCVLDRAVADVFNEIFADYADFTGAGAVGSRTFGKLLDERGLFSQRGTAGVRIRRGIVRRSNDQAQRVTLPEPVPSQSDVSDVDGKKALHARAEKEKTNPVTSVTNVTRPPTPPLGQVEV